MRTLPAQNAGFLFFSLPCMTAPYLPSYLNEPDLVYQPLIDELIARGTCVVPCSNSTDLRLHLAPYAKDGKHWKAIRLGEAEPWYRLGLNTVDPQYAESFCGTIQELLQNLRRVLQSIAMTSAPVHVINET